MHPRRTFLKKATLTSAGMMAAIEGMTFPTFLSKSTLPSALTVVFQGDSITDWGRDKTSTEPNDSGKVGTGYVLLSAAEMLANHPPVEWKYYNRGISGNKVFQLADRWDNDTLALKPDVLSILIGVNDFWHTLLNGYNGTVKVYEDDFRKLLDRTLAALPNVKLIIGEPFALKGGKAISDQWFPTFNDYQKTAQQIAQDYHAAWIPYQSIFDDALTKAAVDYWSFDGVHPTLAGCYLMAQAWNKAFDGMWG